MPEHYVRPPIIGREAPSQRLATWRFRLAAALLTAVLVVVGVLFYQKLTGANSEDPQLSSLATLTRSVAPPPQVIHAGSR